MDIPNSKIYLIRLSILILAGFTISFGDSDDCQGFKCDHNKNICISKDKFCDGVVDCSNRADEPNNCERQTCRVDQFRCKTSGKCIPLSTRCNGVSDCSDHSDEVKCAHENVKCSPTYGKYQCSLTEICISLSDVCNNRIDCQSKEDEGNMCNILCETISCEHKCYESPRGPQCYCKAGYRLTSDNRCKAIDECKKWYETEDNLPKCSQACSSRLGVHHCSCARGYDLMNDMSTCKVKNSTFLLFFLSSDSNILQFDIHTGRTRPLINIDSQIYDLAYDSRQHTIYISTEQKIIKYNLITKQTSKCIEHGLNNQHGIALDYLQRILYIVNSGSSNIIACKLDGSICSVILEQKHSMLKYIVLDPINGRMFWTSVSLHESGIYTADMDGSHSRLIAKEENSVPSGLAIDIATRRVYWLDSRMDKIESCDFRGRFRKTFNSIYQHPVSLGIFEDTVYWGDWAKSSIEKSNKFNGEDLKILSKVSSPNSITLYHPAMEPLNRNACYAKGCSHLCVKSSSGFTCKCPDGKLISKDYKTCKDSKIDNNFLLISNSTNIVRIDPYTIGRYMYTTLQSHAMENVLSIAVDISMYTVYYHDHNYKTISSAKIDALHLGYQMVRDLPKVEGIAVDWINGNKYWTDSIRNEIGMFKENGKLGAHSTILRKGLSKPIAIAVDPINYYLFFSDKETSSSILYRCDLDASSNCKELVIHAKSIYSITLDIHNKTVYYTDEQKGRIESVNYDGTNHIILTKIENAKPYGITFNGIYLFWTDFEERYSLFYMNPNNKKVHKKQLPHSSLIGIISVNHILQPFARGACSFREKCEYMCIPLNPRDNDHTLRCVCDKDSILSADGKSCQKTNVCSSNIICDGRCIPESDKCNGIENCLSGEDEIGCNGASVTCNLNQFTCGDNTCINNTYMCDGKPQCKDHSDETNCNAILLTCKHDQFLCKDHKKCIQQSMKCDTEYDCGDGSDEIDCIHNLCPEFRCKSGKCIKYSTQCNGIADCPHNDDEDVCNIRQTICNGGDFHCSNGQCIAQNRICDNVNDCEDRSDEKNCVKAKTICPSNMFQCGDGSCIDNSKVCNRIRDCKDFEDEHPLLCLKTTTPILKQTTTQKPRLSKISSLIGYDIVQGFCDKGLSCDYGSCIALDEVCNNYTNCEDGSDEGGSCGNGCLPTKSECSQKCKSTPVGHFCFCEDGFTLLPDKKTCVDINECNENPCDHECENVQGGFICKCSEGYDLVDESICKARGSAELFYSVDDGIWSYNENLREDLKLNILSQHKESTLAYEYIESIAIYQKTNTIYWNQMDSIYYMDITSNTPRPLVYKAYSSFIAIDWLSSNLYYSSAKDSMIYVCDLPDALNCAVLLKLEDSDVRDIALHPMKGIMFWTHAGDSACIRTSEMDGSNARHIITRDIIHPVSLTIEFTSSLIFWVDSKLDRIVYCNFKGENRKLLSRTKLHPYGLDVFNGNVFYSDWTTMAIYKINIRSKEEVIVKQLKRRPSAIQLWHEVRQPTKQSSYCDHDKCAHMCVISKSSYTCLCDSNAILSEDHHACNGTTHARILQDDELQSTGNTQNSTSSDEDKDNATKELRNISAKDTYSFDPKNVHIKKCGNCSNGGKCIYLEDSKSYKCNCLDNFYGKQCENIESTSSSKKTQSSKSTWIIWTLLILMCIIAICAALFIQYRRKNILVQDMNIRYLRSELNDTDDDKKSLAYENPGFKNEARRPFCLLEQHQYASLNSIDDQHVSDKKLLV